MSCGIIEPPFLTHRKIESDQLAEISKLAKPMPQGNRLRCVSMPPRHAAHPRVPRSRPTADCSVVGVVWYGLACPDQHPAKADIDASEAAWFSAAELPPLAFDPETILAAGAHRPARRKHEVLVKRGFLFEL